MSPPSTVDMNSGGNSNSVAERLPIGAVLGAAGLAIPLVGGRWGSHIGLAPFYLADTLVLIGAAVTISGSGWRCYSPRLPRVFWATWTFTALFVVASVLTGQGSAVTRLRDLLPWIYLLLIPVVIYWATVAGRARVTKYLTCTLLMHAVWAVPAMLGILPDFTLPIGVLDEPLFDERPDIDVPLLAALVALVLHGRRPNLWIICLVLLSAAASLTQTSRAGLVGGVVGILLFSWATGSLRGSKGVRRAFFASGAVIVTLAWVLPMVANQSEDAADAGALARAGLYGNGRASASGTGTADARARAWELVLEFYEEAGSPPLGIGAGTEIVRDSGAVLYLSGDESVRAPHNWWIHAVVRMGPLGLTLWVVCLAAAAWGNLGQVVKSQSTLLPALGALLAASVLVTASVGVVIEAPFGSHVLLIGIAALALRGTCDGHSPPLPIDSRAEGSRARGPSRRRRSDGNSWNLKGVEVGGTRRF